MGKLIDLTDEKKGRWTVQKRSGSNSKGEALWLCVCDCGETKEVPSSALRKNASSSCGCLKLEMFGQREYGEGYTNEIYRRYKNAATERNRTFTILKEYFIILLKSNCYYCGQSPNKFMRFGKRPHNGQFLVNGIDRVNNDEGYILENCVPCCSICNMAKRDLTQQEFFEWAHRLSDNIRLKEITIHDPSFKKNTLPPGEDV